MRVQLPRTPGISWGSSLASMHQWPISSTQTSWLSEIMTKLNQRWDSSDREDKERRPHEKDSSLDWSWGKITSPLLHVSLLSLPSCINVIPPSFKTSYLTIPIRIQSAEHKTPLCILIDVYRNILFPPQLFFRTKCYLYSLESMLSWAWQPQIGPAVESRALICWS